MKEKIDSNVSRRDFVKALGLMGVGSVVGAGSALAQPAAPADAAPAKTTKVPTRAFGKTGVNVSMLGLGGIFDTISNQLVLKLAVDWGVTYWDTSESYGGGNSEK
ncbi:MAG TPA: twin-arginine translocation signal domain-containing protein, partial [Verrucomicrobiae bacterium]